MLPTLTSLSEIQFDVPRKFSLDGNGIRFVYFDIDDVLVETDDLRVIIKNFYEQIFAPASRKVHYSPGLEFLVEPDAAYTAFNDFNLTQINKTGNEFLIRMKKDLDLIYEHADPVPNADAVDFLELLASSGVHMGYITRGTREIQEGKLDSLHISDYFQGPNFVTSDYSRVTWQEGVFSFDYLSKAELFPQAVSEALTYLRDKCVYSDASDVLYIDDKLKYVLAAHDAGMTAVWYKRGKISLESELESVADHTRYHQYLNHMDSIHIIDSLEQLYPLFE